MPAFCTVAYGFASHAQPVQAPPDAPAVAAPGAADPAFQGPAGSLIRRWDALAEHRWLRVRDGGDRSGWLVGVDRQISDHFKVGVGYNFTDFSDLTQLDYNYQDWSLNVADYD